MPTPIAPVLQEKEAIRVRLGLEPAHNMFYSLFLLACGDRFAGVDPWVEKARDRLPEERLKLNLNVISGLFGALKPARSFASFPEYVEDLAGQPPAEWVTRLFDYNDRIAKGKRGRIPDVERSVLMADFDRYLAYLLDGFGEELVEEDVERQAHAWIGHPQEMQKQAIDHLHFMWDRELKPEWKRAAERVEASLEAMEELRVDRKDPIEAIRIAGAQEPNEWLIEQIDGAEQIILVPSPHLGPHLGHLDSGGTIWVLFGARVPAGSSVRSREVDRSRLLMRLNALADDTRLQIMDIVMREDEVCAQDFITQLEISQSSTSRHLRQLTATGLLTERRVDGGKCYRMNGEGVQTLVDSLEGFFSISGDSRTR